MKAHQKDGGGNNLIQNMFHIYFKMPKNFVEQLYLSQVQQMFAIRMGCEWWRTQRPINRGILFWQVNDCWPVSSWSSIEYDGRWKQLQYHAAHFFNPMHAAFLENNKTKTVTLVIVNDLLKDVTVKGWVRFIGFDGKQIHEWRDLSHESKSDSAFHIWNLDLKGWTEQDRQKGFFYCEFEYKDGETTKKISNWFFACRFKNSEMKVAKVGVSLRQVSEGTEITLTTDVPAFFVHLESDKVLRFSDSSLLLFPGEKRIVTCKETIGISDLVVYQLATVG
jgi:beta-mannosidase